MSNIKPFAFVLMPFDGSFGDIYIHGIKKLCDEKGIVAERVDEQNFNEGILQRIYRQIENCDFIIADMTGQNSNVFYEVGYAHAKQKLCALLTQSADDIPFDLKHHPHVIYDGTISDLRQKLSEKIDWLVGETALRKNRSLSVSLKHTDILKVSDWSHTGVCDVSLRLKNETERRSSEIEAIYILTSDRWMLSVDGRECAYEAIGEGRFSRRHFIPTPVSRLSPSAFAEVAFSMEATFWSNYSGSEKQDEYSVKGNIGVAIATAEGQLEIEHTIEATFEEIPF